MTPDRIDGMELGLFWVLAVVAVAGALGLLFARKAVHAAMAGKTDVLVGYWHNVFIHVPIPAVVRRQKRLDPQGGVWIAVQEATGQPHRFGAAGRDQVNHGGELP